MKVVHRVGDFNPDMQIIELRPSERLVWKCVGGREPWADNTFRFELAPPDDSRTGCGSYLDSLRLLCEAGAGRPFVAATP